MNATTPVMLTYEQIDLLRAIMFEYYNTNDIKCEEESMLRDQLEDILADAEGDVLDLEEAINYE